MLHTQISLAEFRKIGSLVVGARPTPLFKEGISGTLGNLKR
jgi:hypothetical protein